MEPYYYTKMTKPQQAAYRAMEQGIASLADSFQVPRLEKQELGEVFFRLSWITRRFSGRPASGINTIRTRPI